MSHRGRILVGRRYQKRESADDQFYTELSGDNSGSMALSTTMLSMSAPSTLTWFAVIRDLKRQKRAHVTYRLQKGTVADGLTKPLQAVHSERFVNTLCWVW